MGVVECAKHELLQPFNVLYEKEGEFWEESFSSQPLVIWSPPPYSLQTRVWQGNILSKHFLSPIGEFVAQFKFTVLLMPNGPMRITSGPFEPDLYKSEMEVQDAELKVSVGWKWWASGIYPGSEDWMSAKSWKELQYWEWDFAFPPYSSKFVFLLPPVFQALLQSSASRKTQKKKKKKVCYSHPSLAGPTWSLYSAFPGHGGGIDFCISLFPPSQPWPGKLRRFVPK